MFGFNAPTLVFEALDHIDNLVLHGKSKVDAVDHAFHRYGVNKDYIWRCLLTEERMRHARG